MKKKIQVIPAIDLSEGKCVRLSQGDFDRMTVYGEDPLKVALEFEAVGVRSLHVVDLDGARIGSPQNISVLKSLRENTNLRIDFGGGLRKRTDLEEAFSAGADQVTVGSFAAREPDRFMGWIRAYGPERFILGADARQGRIAVSGWQEATDLSLVEFIARFREEGIRDVLCTAIERDGMLNGPETNLYKELMTTFPDIRLIASGGVSSLEDLDKLQEAGIPAVVVGKAIYENRIGLEDLQKLC